MSRKSALRVALAAILGLLLLAIYVGRVRADMEDFEVDYTAGLRLRGGEDLYQTQDAYYMYKYQPAAAILELPFSLPPLEAAKFIFYLFSIGCIVLVLALSYRLLPEERGKSPKLAVLTFLILANCFSREILKGQINVLITALLLLMLWLLLEARARRPAALGAGALWSAAFMLKPPGLIFLPYLVLTRRWSALAGGLALMAAATLALIPAYGLEGTLRQHEEWVTTLSASTPELLTNVSNVSLLGLFNKWTGDQELSLVLFGASAVGLAALMLVLIRGGRGLRRQLVLDGAMLLILMPLLSPLGWHNTFLSSALGVMLLLQHRSEFSRGWRIVLVTNLCLIGLTAYDLMGRELYLFYMDWSIVTLNFLLVLGLLAALRWRRAC